MMADESQDHVDQLFFRLDELQKTANVNAVFGPPVTTGDKTIIPIASVTYGFGLGFGEESQEGDSDSAGGGGGAAIAKPLGLAEITPERTRIEPIVNEQAVVAGGLALAAWAVFWITRAVIKIMRR